MPGSRRSTPAATSAPSSAEELPVSRKQRRKQNYEAQQKEEREEEDEGCSKGGDNEKEPRSIANLSHADPCGTTLDATTIRSVKPLKESKSESPGQLRASSRDTRERGRLERDPCVPQRGGPAYNDNLAGAVTGPFPADSLWQRWGKRVSTTKHSPPSLVVRNFTKGDVSVGSASSSSSSATIATAAPMKGIYNPSNACYLASVLQALVHCPPFSHLCVLIASAAAAAESTGKLSSVRTEGGSNVTREILMKTVTESCPNIVCLGRWITSSYFAGGKSNFPRQPLSSSSPSSLVIPSVMPPKLPVSDNRAKRHHGLFSGRDQQDAQEFLQHLLEEVEAEMKNLEESSEVATLLSVMSQAIPEQERSGSPATSAKNDKKQKGGIAVVRSASGANDEKGWVTVGKRKSQKFTFSTHQDTSRSDVFSSNLFGGELHSHLTGAKGGKVTSVTVQKFFCLALDIGMRGDNQRYTQSISILDALAETMAPETVRITSEDGTEAQNLEKQFFFGHLPVCLVFHIRRWAIDERGEVTKTDRELKFGTSLNIPAEMCFPEHTSAERGYQLRSVVCHRGAGIGAGHYVTYLVSSSSAAEASSNSAKAARKGENSCGPQAMTTTILCNDARLSVSNVKRAISDSPYLLFYVRK